jgi:hypothetical protein
MTLQVQSGVTLQTFSGINVELGGAIHLQNATLDTQYVEVFGGMLSGSGSIVTGSGPIPGQVENRGGTVAPGNGIGTLAIDGRFASGPAATMEFELGGTAPGQFDLISVIGDVGIDGKLVVSLVNPFTPSIGNSFEIITATGNIAGTFDDLMLPGGYTWNVAYNPGSIVLSVTGIGTPGDFNGDGKVDAADYVVWRKTGGTSQQYQDWRSHFGAGMGAGSGDAGVNNAGSVPEPSSALLVALMACSFVSRRRLTRPARS